MITDALTLAGGILLAIYGLSAFFKWVNKRLRYPNIDTWIAVVNGHKDKIESSKQAGLILVGTFYVILAFFLKYIGGEDLWLGDLAYVMSIKIVGHNTILINVLKVITFFVLLWFLGKPGIKSAMDVGLKLLEREDKKKKR